MEGGAREREESRVTPRFLSNPGRMEFPFTEMRKTVGKAGLGGKSRTSLLGMTSLRCLLDIQVKIIEQAAGY